MPTSLAGPSSSVVARAILDGLWATLVPTGRKVPDVFALGVRPAFGARLADCRPGIVEALAQWLTARDQRTLAAVAAASDLRLVELAPLLEDLETELTDADHPPTWVPGCDNPSSPRSRQALAAAAARVSAARVNLLATQPSSIQTAAPRGSGLGASLGQSRSRPAAPTAVDGADGSDGSSGQVTMAS